MKWIESKSENKSTINTNINHTPLLFFFPPRLLSSALCLHKHSLPGADILERRRLPPKPCLSWHFRRYTSCWKRLSHSQKHVAWNTSPQNGRLSCGICSTEDLPLSLGPLCVSEIFPATYWIVLLFYFLFLIFSFCVLDNSRVETSLRVLFFLWCFLEWYNPLSCLLWDFWNNWSSFPAFVCLSSSRGWDCVGQQLRLVSEL